MEYNNNHKVYEYQIKELNNQLRAKDRLIGRKG